MNKLIIILTYVLFTTISWTQVKVVGVRISDILLISIVFLTIAKLITENKTFVFAEYKKVIAVYCFLFLYSVIISFINLFQFAINDNLFSFYSFYLNFLYRFIRYGLLVLTGMIIIYYLNHTSLNKKILSYFILLGLYVPVIAHINDLISHSNLYRETLFCIEPSEAGFYVVVLTLFSIYLNKKIIFFIIPLLFVLIEIKSSGTFLALILAIGVTVFLSLFLKRIQLLKTLVASCLVIALFSIFYDQTLGYVYEKIITELNANTNTSIIERLSAYKASIKMFIDHPFGVGVGNYGWLIGIYNDNPLYVTHSSGSFHSNSAIAFMISDFGVGGIVFLLMFIPYFLAMAWKEDNQVLVFLGLFILFMSPNFMIFNNLMLYVIVFLFMNKRKNKIEKHFTSN